MSTQVTINGSNYTIPSQGDPAGWGSQLNSILTALTSVINSSSGPADITLTTFNITNNQASASAITALSFDTSAVRSAIISYSIYRTTSLSELCETGNIYLSYKNTANSWELAQYYSGSSGVVFTITSGGQVKYTSTNLSGTGYSGKITFKAQSFLQ